MSRTDKRAGRVKYTLGAGLDRNLSDNFRKSVLGDLGAPDFNYLLAIYLSEGKPFGTKGLQLYKIARGHIEGWLKARSLAGDFASLAQYAELVRIMVSDDFLDPVGAEICEVYGHLRNQKGGRVLKYSLPPPSGKELAFAMDRLRAIDKKPPSSLTIGAIVEKAKRMGLKLKGRRKLRQKKKRLSLRRAIRKG